MEKITVIIPVYNVENYLRVCIESVLSQTYSELEIIVVDDGSTDNSGHISDEFAKADSRVKVIHKTNGGLSSARNAALDIASGVWIAMIDSDDYWEPDALEHLHGLAKANNADMVVARGRRVDVNGNAPDDFIPQSMVHKSGDVSKDEFWQERTNDMFYVVAWSKLYRKELFENIRFPEGEINEDVAVLWKIIDKCQKIYVSDKKIYNWRATPNSITHSKFGYRNLFLAHALLDEVKYIKQSGLSEKTLYLTEHNAFSTTVKILSKAYRLLKEPEHIAEADKLYLSYKQVAKEMLKHIRFSGKKSLSVGIKATLFMLNKFWFFKLYDLKNKQ